MKIPKGATVQPINSTDVVVSEHLPIHPDHREDARRAVWSGCLAQQVLAKDGKPPSPAPGEPSHVFAASDGTRNGPVTLFVSREMWAELRREETT